MKNLLKIACLAFVIGFVACNDDDPVVVETNTIVDVAIDNNLTSLVAAVRRANLDITLAGPGPYTVLAPSDAAFSAFLQANNFNSLTDVPVDLLRNILLNHVISGELMSTDLTTGYANTNATSDASGTNMSIYINTENGVSFNGISNVGIANVEADNGIVHVVDAVIGLPSVVTFATADPNFSIVVEALTRENDFTYVETLSTPNGTAPAPFTVFAPINDAFVDLLAELQLNALSDVPKATLTSTLNTHVVAGANVLESNLSDNMPVSTLGGGLTVNLTSNGATLTASNNSVSSIIATDVQANNGVIHAINKVVLE